MYKIEGDSVEWEACTIRIIATTLHLKGLFFHTNSIYSSLGWKFRAFLLLEVRETSFGQKKAPPDVAGGAFLGSL
jgi:hypothetical protein